MNIKILFATFETSCITVSSARFAAIPNVIRTCRMTTPAVDVRRRYIQKQSVKEPSSWVLPLVSATERRSRGM